MAGVILTMRRGHAWSQRHVATLAEAEQIGCGWAKSGWAWEAREVK